MGVNGPGVPEIVIVPHTVQDPLPGEGKLVGDFLTKNGYEVLEAGDGQEALDIFYRQKDLWAVLSTWMPPHSRTSPAAPWLVRRRMASIRATSEKLRFAVSAILNVLLVLAIAAMFYISFASEQYPVSS